MNRELQMALYHAEQIVNSYNSYCIVRVNDYDEVTLETGPVKLDGTREVPTASRKYYLDCNGDVKIVVYAHA